MEPPSRSWIPLNRTSDKARPLVITVHKPSEIARIRASCQIVWEVQQTLQEAVRPGVSTLELDEIAESTIRGHGAIPAFKGYRGFPASICASINAEAVHGFPRPTPLAAGDLVSVDVGVELDGYFGDGAFTLGVGAISEASHRMLDTTRAALRDAIAAAQPRGRLSDISHAVQSRAESEGLSVIQEYGGHGIGRSLHEDPHIPNHGRPGRGILLRPGYVVAIEPILSMGDPDIELAENGWTVLTCDRSPVAHFEHTIAITADGPQILTLPAGEGSPDPGAPRPSAP